MAGELNLPVPVDNAVSRRRLVVLILARLVLNVQQRVVYPFLPAIGRGLGVPLETASLLLTVRYLLSASSPVFGLLSDRYGRRSMILLGLGTLALGALLFSLTPGMGLALLAFAFLGVGKATYDPALQAFVGDAVSYERRRIMGLVELSWSLAWLVGVPATGFMIAAWGWRSPFWAVGALALVSLIGVRGAWPAGRQSGGRSGRPTKMAEPSRLSRSALLALGVSCLLVMANENMFIVYGAWFENQFGLSVTSLGLVSVVIAVAELVAEGASAGLVDRLGKRRATVAGMTLNAVAYLLLPQLAGSLGSALGGVVLMILAFEFSIVCMLPLVSELAPTARGTFMALNFAAMSVGRMVSTVTGPRLWLAGGLPLNALVSAVLVALAALLLWRGVVEGQPVPAELT